MNSIGKFLKKLRIEHGELLFDMAQRLHVSSAFLSAVENDKRSAPPSWIDTLTAEYDLTPIQQNELTEAVNESIKQIRLDVGHVKANKRNCALAFARNFDSFSDEDIQEILAVLDKRRS